MNCGISALLQAVVERLGGLVRPALCCYRFCLRLCRTNPVYRSEERSAASGAFQHRPEEFALVGAAVHRLVGHARNICSFLLAYRSCDCAESKVVRTPNRTRGNKLQEVMYRSNCSIVKFWSAIFALTRSPIDTMPRILCFESSTGRWRKKRSVMSTRPCETSISSVA